MIEQLKQDETFIRLKEDIDAKQQEFESVQDEIEKKDGIINRNKKIIEGIHSDISSLEDSINNIQSDGQGNVDLNAIEKYSTKIYANKNKISVLTKLNEKINNEISYLKITTYFDTEKELNILYKKLFDYSLQFCVKLLFKDKFVDDLNILFKFFRNSAISDKYIMNTTNDSSINEAFITYLNQYIKPLLADTDLGELGIQGYKKKFNISTSLIERQAQKKRLEAILGIATHS